MAFLKIGALAFLVAGSLWAAGFSVESVASPQQEASISGFLGAVALGILGYKGFTTITNNGSEIKTPKRNVGRAIIPSHGICVFTRCVRSCR